MSSYIKVLWPIVVGGQIAKAGELVEVTGAEARLLISLGKAEPAEVEAEPDVRTKGKRNAASGL
jgi:hypothetical protein